MAKSTTKVTDLAGLAIQDIPLAKIVRNPKNRRSQMDAGEMARMVKDMQANGVRKPIVVRKDGDGFMLIAGERRWLAAKAAGRTKVPCQIVTRTLSSGQERILIVQDNDFGEEIKPVDKALSYKDIMDDMSWTAAKLIEELNLNPRETAKLLKLLKLPEDVQAQVNGGAISLQAAMLLADQTPEVAQRTAAALISGTPLKEIQEKLGKKTPTRSNRPAAQTGAGNAKVKPRHSASYQAPGGILVTITCMKRKLTKADELQALGVVTSNLEL